MADADHLSLLQRGSAAWNRWRQEHPGLTPDLRWANLSLANLRGANLSQALLDRTNLSGAMLSQADLSKASLREAGLGEANLSSAMLDEANLSRANLSRANLSRASLQGANLNSVNLGRANLFETNLERAKLDDAFFYKTAFGNTRLAGVLGLDTCHHLGPSILDQHTLAHHPHLPEPFLRGCGLQSWEIEAARLHDPSLAPEQITRLTQQIHQLRTSHPLQIHNLFICYSYADTAFVEHLESYLKAHHILYWHDVHDAPAGQPNNIVIRTMRQDPTVLLVLSANSAEQTWLEYEIDRATRLEKTLNRNALCLVALDDYWTTYDWPETLAEHITQRQILDASAWQTRDDSEALFERLRACLGLFYQDEAVK